MSLVLLHPNVGSFVQKGQEMILQYNKVGAFTKYTLTEEETDQLINAIKDSIDEPAKTFFVNLKSVTLNLPKITGKVYVRVRVYDGQWDIFEYVSTLTEHVLVSAWVSDTMDMVHPLLKRSINEFWKHTEQKYLNINCHCGHRNRVKVMLHDAAFRVTCKGCGFIGVYSTHRSKIPVADRLSVYRISEHMGELQPF